MTLSMRALTGSSGASTAASRQARCLPVAAAPAATRRQQQRPPSHLERQWAARSAASGVASRRTCITAAAPAGGEPGSSSSSTALTTPAAIMQDLATCFTQQLQMTNGCVPASLLLRDVLVERGVLCCLRSGYLLITLPEVADAPASDIPPPLFATPHMWVELLGDSSAVLDIGMALAANAGLETADHQLSASLPPEANLLDAGAGAGALQAAMAALADGETDTGAYWAGAPPNLKKFRTAMLQRFAV